MHGCSPRYFLFLLFFSCLQPIAESVQPVYKVLVVWTNPVPHDHALDTRNARIQEVVDATVQNISTGNNFNFTLQVEKKNFSCTDQDIADFVWNLADNSDGYKTVLAKVCPEHCVAFAHLLSDLKLHPVMFGCNRRMDMNYVYPNVTLLDGGTWLRQSTNFPYFNDRDLLYTTCCGRDSSTQYKLSWSNSGMMQLAHEGPLASYIFFWRKLIEEMGHKNFYAVLSADYNFKISTQAMESMINMGPWSADRNETRGALLHHLLSHSEFIDKPASKIFELLPSDWSASAERFYDNARKQGVQSLVLNLNLTEFVNVTCELQKRRLIRDDALFLSHLPGEYSVEDILLLATNSNGTMCSRDEMTNVLNKTFFTDAYVTEQARTFAGTEATWGTIRDVTLMRDGLMAIAHRAQICVDKGCTAIHSSSELSLDEVDQTILSIHDVDFNGWSGRVKFAPTCCSKYQRRYSRMYTREKDNHGLYIVTIPDNLSSALNFSLLARNIWDEFSCLVGDVHGVMSRWASMPNLPFMQNLRVKHLAAERDTDVVIIFPIVTFPFEKYGGQDWRDYPDDLGYAYIVSTFSRHDAWAPPPGENDYYRWGIGWYAALNPSNSPGFNDLDPHTFFKLGEFEWLHKPRFPLENKLFCDKGMGIRGGLECEPCREDEFQAGDSFVCSKCPGGTIGKEENAVRCAACPAGSYMDEIGSTAAECKPCGDGYESPEGSAACFPCAKGFYRRSRMQDEGDAGLCEPCPFGQYSAEVGATACTACHFTDSTLRVAATSVDECVCSPGKYLDCVCHGTSGSCWYNLRGCVLQEDIMQDTRATSTCLPCPAGFTCDGGLRNYSKHASDVDGITYTWQMHAQPVLKPKYYSLPDKPYEAFWCESAQEMCLGGRPGHCDGKRFGLQCANCHKGSVSKPGKSCEECVEGYFVLPSSIIVLAGIFFVLNRLANSTSAAGTAPAKAILATSFTSMLHLGQMLGVVALFEIPWPGMLGNLMKFFKVFVFDVGSVDTTCFSGQDTLTGKYVLGVSLTMLMMMLFLALWAVSKVVSMIMGVPTIAMDINKVFNTTGIIFSVFFIGVSKSIFRVLECSDQNPNSIPTLLNYEGHYCSIQDLVEVLPWVITYSLIYIGAMVTLYINVYLAAKRVFYTDANFRVRYRFLLGRWSPKFYYWGAVWLGKNIALSLVPVLANIEIDEDGRQRSLLALLWIILCVLPCVGMSAYVKPFKEPLANQLDVVSSGCIILLCATGLNIKQFNDARTQIVPMHLRETISVIAVVAFSLGLIGSIAVATLDYFMRVEHRPLADRIAKTLCELHDVYVEDRKMAESDFKEMTGMLTASDEYYLHVAMDNIDHVLMCNFSQNSMRGLKPTISESAKRLAPCVDGCLPTQPPAGFAPASPTTQGNDKASNEK